MALFTRRSVIRNDDVDYSVRVKYSSQQGESKPDSPYSPPPFQPVAAPPPPAQPLAPADEPMAPEMSTQPRKKKGDFLSQARELTGQIREAGRSRIAGLASRVAKNLAPAEQITSALGLKPRDEMAAEEPEDFSARRRYMPRVIVPSEEDRWREYEASRRGGSGAMEQPPSQEFSRAPETRNFESSPSTDLLKARAERVLTNRVEEAPRVEPEPEPAPRFEPQPEPEPEVCAEPAQEDAAPRKGKYSSLVEQLNEHSPHNWETDSERAPENFSEPAQASHNWQETEEPSMPEQQNHGTQNALRPGNGTARQVTLDGDANIIELNKGSRFAGQLRFTGTVIVGGEVQGELDAVRLIVRETGVVNARLSGDSITIAGRVNGDVSARVDLEITSSGRITGDIIAPQLRAEPGAAFKGRCAVGERGA